MREYLLLGSLWRAAFLFPFLFSLIWSPIKAQDVFIMEKGEDFMVEQYVRRAVVNASDFDSTCPIQDCNPISVSVSVTPQPGSCRTEFCYSIFNNGSQRISAFELLGVNYIASEFSSSLSWQLNTFGRISYNFPQNPNSRASYCFVLEGEFTTTTSKMLVNMGPYSCEKEVLVAGLKKTCAIDCVLDRNFANAVCSPCPAACDSQNTVGLARGTQTCSLKVLTTPNSLGAPCQPTTTRECTKTCPVDCSITGALWEECTANCAKPTVIQTGYYSVAVNPLNGGTPCSLPTPATRTCTLPVSVLQTSCARNCVVGGTPEPNCSKLCKQAPNTLVTAPFSYTQTLTPPVYGGSPCPSGTTTCDCRATCELQPYATYTGECNAKCLALDGSTATGLKVFEYPIKVATGNSTYCATTSYKTCYSSCSCEYTTSSKVGQCTVTTTNSAITPFVGYGIQKFSAMGTVAGCLKSFDEPCTTTFTPIDCQRSTDCRGCSCMWYGTPYSLTTSAPCLHYTIQFPAYGGSPCPSQTFTQTCSQSCPGCEYDQGYCECNYQFTTTSSGTSIMRGVSRCLYAPNSKYSLCTTRTSINSSQSCSTTIVAPTCLPVLLGCEDLCTPSITATETLPYRITGQRRCSFSDTRLINNKPPTCTPTTTMPITCTSTLAPENCQVDYVCPTPSAACPEVTVAAVGRETLVCDITTVKSASYGGTCSAPTRSTSVVTKTCVPTPSPSCFESVVDYNLIVFGTASGINAYIGGRAAIASDANFTNYEIGKNIRSTFDRCDIVPPNALVVGGSLNLQGTVYNGNTLVNNSCTASTIDSRCNVTCGLNLIPGCSSYYDAPFNFIGNYTYLKKKSIELSKLPNTAQISVDVETQTTITIIFTGRSFEVVNVPFGPRINNFIFPVVPPSNATIIMNIPGTAVAFIGFDMEILKQAQVIFNFYEANIIHLEAMDIPGTVLAVDAKMSGGSTIRGSAFVRELWYIATSAKFMYRPFRGRCSA